LSDLFTNPSTKVLFPVSCENSIQDPDLLLAAETTQKPNKRKREAICLGEKARKLYNLMYLMNEVPLLTFFNGWLGSFKARHGIQEYK